MAYSSMSFPAESEPENELLDCTLLPLGSRQLLVDGATVLRHLDPVNLGKNNLKINPYYFKKSFPPQWGGFISFFKLQLQLQIAILRLPMLVVVFFLP
jgi:hypothetical protein